MQFDNIRLLVDDFDGCFRFYRDTLGFRATWGAEGEAYAAFAAGEGLELALFRRALMAEAVGATDDTPGQSGARSDHIALIIGMDPAERLADAVGRLKASDVTFITELTSRPAWGIRVAHLRDPDGNLIELMEPLPQQEQATD
ncbi:MAG: VOC family protein [Ktedonobacterales bacterium]